MIDWIWDIFPSRGSVDQLDVENEETRLTYMVLAEVKVAEIGQLRGC